MIDINVEIDPDLLGIDEKESINILKSILEKELISKAKINLIFAKDKLLNNLKIEYFQKDHLTDVIAFRINDYTDTEVEGEIYISLERAIDNAKEEVRNYCKVANATNLPFEDKSVDVSISITTLHNLEEKELVKALLEIERVSKRGSFITLDAYRNNEEKDRMEAWNLTAKTVMHVDSWAELFKDVGNFSC